MWPWSIWPFSLIFAGEDWRFSPILPLIRLFSEECSGLLFVTSTLVRRNLMKIRRSSAIWSSSLLALFLLLFYCVGAQAQSKNGNKYACLEPNPAALCNASNTCGSASTPCTVDVKRTANSAEAVASITKPKGNATFCVQVGTTLTWQSTSKNTGFVVDFGPSDPFAQGGTIIGGSDRSVSVAAKKPGCYKYSAGACVSGAIYGMCGTANAEVIVVGGGN